LIPPVGKNKLSKFADMDSFRNVVQVPFRELQHHDHPLKGSWNQNFFRNNGPIVLELGCGKGEYTTGLATLFPEMNFIGIDIKEARIWKGAKYALEKGLENVAFLRTHIEMIGQFFAEKEISEIWLTFPDPQMKKTRKRLTSTRFIEYYRTFLRPGGLIHLKTDSRFQFRYTLEVIQKNSFELISVCEDVYARAERDERLQIQTFYEKQWLARGISIKYLCFIPHSEPLQEPDVAIEPDSYRSFGRGALPQ